MLYALLNEVDAHKTSQNTTQRLLRFQGDNWLRQCIDAFRVQVSCAIAAQLPLPKAISDTMAELTTAHAAFVQTPAEHARIVTVQWTKVAASSSTRSRPFTVTYATAHALTSRATAYRTTNRHAETSIYQSRRRALTSLVIEAAVDHVMQKLEDRAENADKDLEKLQEKESCARK